MAIKHEKRIFVDNWHNYLLRIDEDLFQSVVKLSQREQTSINAILNEAIAEYVEKKA